SFPHYHLLFRLSLQLLYFIATATTYIYPLSLHDALPISLVCEQREFFYRPNAVTQPCCHRWRNSQDLVSASEIVMDEVQRHSEGDRKSTRLNSSHQIISYAVFCLKKKKRKK